MTQSAHLDSLPTVDQPKGTASAKAQLAWRLRHWKSTAVVPQRAVVDCAIPNVLRCGC